MARTTRDPIEKSKG